MVGAGGAALPLLSESDRRFQPAFELEKKSLESVAPLEQKLELHKFQKTGIVARQQRDDAASDYVGSGPTGQLCLRVTAHLSRRSRSCLSSSHKTFFWTLHGCWTHLLVK